MKNNFIFLLSTSCLFLLISCKSNKYVPLSEQMMKENNITLEDLVYKKGSQKGVELKLSGKIVLGTTDPIAGKVEQGGIKTPAETTDYVTLEKGKFGVIVDVDPIKKRALVSYDKTDKTKSVLIGVAAESGVFLLVNSVPKDSTGFWVDYQGVKPLLEGQEVNFLVRKHKGKKQETSSSPTGRRWGQ